MEWEDDSDSMVFYDKDEIDRIEAGMDPNGQFCQDTADSQESDDGRTPDNNILGMAVIPVALGIGALGSAIGTAIGTRIKKHQEKKDAEPSHGATEWDRAKSRKR